MKIETIELEGYSSYKNYTLVQIPEGITGIVGVFDDAAGKSNGVGKSSLVMSVIYALYGEGEADKILEFVNDNSDSMYVRVKFIKDGQAYTCERGINKGASYLDLFQEDVRLGDKIDTTQEHINRIIGMDYDMFTASVFFEQMNMDKFIDNNKTSPEERRNYINKVLDIEIWRTLSKDISKDIKKLSDSILSSQNNITIWEEKSKSIGESLFKKEPLEKNIENLYKRKIEANEFIQEFYKYKSDLDMLSLKKSSLISESRDLEGIVTKIDATKKIEEELSLKLNSFNLEDVEPEINGYTEDLLKFKDNLEFKESEEQELKDKNNNLAVEIARINQDIKNLESQKLNIGSGVCPTCKQEVTEDHLQEENLKVSNQLDSINKTLEPLNKSKLDILKSLDIIKTEKGQLKLSIENSELKIKTLEDRKNRNIIDYNSCKNNLDICKSQLSSFEENKLNKIEKIGVLELDIKSLEETLSKIQFNESELKQKTIELTNIDKSLNSLSLELGSLLEKEKSKKDLDNQIDSEKKLLNSYKEEKSVNDELYKIFLEIPKNIFNESIASIEQFSNEIIEHVMPNLVVKIYEDTSKKNSPIVIGFEKNGKYRSYKRLSGGQKTIVNIGLRLGFSKVITQQTMSNIQFIVMDEPFGALDEENRTLVKKILTLISESFNQILVITHTEDAESFPNLITIHMDQNEISYIN